MNTLRFALVALCLCAAPIRAGAEVSGVVVASVEEIGAAAQAGVQVGDLLQRWEVSGDGHEPGQGQITSPWSFIEVEQEHAGGVTVELSGQRDGEAVIFSLSPPREWGVVVHPLLPEGERQTLQQGVETIASGAFQEGIQLLRELADPTGVAEERSVWFLYRASLALESAGRLQEAAELLEEALQGAEESEHADELHLQLTQVLLRSGALEEAVAHAEHAVALRSGHETRRGLALARAFALLAGAQLKLMRIDAAEEVLERAHEICVRLAPESMVMATVLNGLGSVAIRRGQLDPAEQYYDQAWGLFEALDPSSLRSAAVAHNLGAIALGRGELDAADVWFERALALRESLAPDSLAPADTLVALGIVALRRGQTAAVEEYAGRAVALQHRHAPGSQSESYGLELLGAAAWGRGDLARAERSFLRVLEIRERFAPGSIMSANTLNNLGAVAHERGDYAKAEEYHRRALEIRRKEAPGSLDVALSLHNLGTVMWVRQDLDAGESYLRQAIAIREEQAPDSVYVAESYANLGGLNNDRGRKAEAEQLMMKALACWRAAGPDSLDVALVLGNLANWKISEGDLDGAEPLITQSLRIREKVAPGGAANALALQSMGQLAGKRGKVEMAEKYLRRSLIMFENSGVATTARAETWDLLGSLLREAGRTEGALDAYSRAIDDLEGVVGRLGGSEDVHSNFRAKHHDMYQNLIDLLVELGRDEQAFNLLERSRARGFLNMLDQRELLFSIDISEELDRQWRLARTEVESITVELSQVSAGETAQRDELRQALQSSHVRLREIQDQIRAEAPRLAALTAPEPLDLERSRLALDKGTVALSYSVGAERTQLFVLGPSANDFRVIALDLGDEMLRRKIRRLRNAVTHATSGLDTVNRVSADLSRLLLAPAGDEISRARRVLVVPDGPLHLLPFAVLPTPNGEEYLIQAKPLHSAPSVTVFAELKAERRKRSEWRVAGFGAPNYLDGDHEAGTTGLLAAYTRGEPLSPLPWSRDEVSGLRDLFPDTASVWLGADATEERARSVGSSADILHFACHALVDENRPLESALVLTIPETPGEGAHNGLLQAWEVIESVRLDADLVVLSACRTALGRELAGEGIVGLTRAFQFAGARSVVASLWPVADRSTAELMSRFYQHLAAGSTTDEALGAAQLELASGPLRVTGGETLYASHPYFWAAFQLSGDWQ